MGNWQEELAPNGGTLGSSALSAPTFERVVNHTDRLVSAAAVAIACRERLPGLAAAAAACAQPAQRRLPA